MFILLFAIDKVLLISIFQKGVQLPLDSDSKEFLDARKIMNEQWAKLEKLPEEKETKKIPNLHTKKIFLSLIFLAKSHLVYYWHSQPSHSVNYH